MIVIRDTREKYPWDFSMYEEVECLIDRKLPCGDYSLEGYEDKLAIERKRSTGEISLNFGAKRQQFEVVLSNMSKLEIAYIICEFPESHLSQFPKNSGIPKNRWGYLRLTATTLINTIESFQDKYGVSFIFAEDDICAQEEAIKIFRQVL